MGTWARQIDRFDRKYDKAFGKDPLFGADLMDRIHKHLQVFLYSCNKTTIEDVGLGDLAEFEGIQKNVDRGEWLASTPVWVYRPEQKEEGRQK